MAALPHVLQFTEGASCTSAVNICRRRTKRARVSWYRPYQLSATATSRLPIATLTRCLNRLIIEILSGLAAWYRGTIPHINPLRERAGAREPLPERLARFSCVRLWPNRGVVVGTSASAQRTV